MNAWFIIHTYYLYSLLKHVTRYISNLMLLMRANPLRYRAPKYAGYHKKRNDSSRSSDFSLLYLDHSNPDPRSPRPELVRSTRAMEQFMQILFLTRLLGHIYSRLRNLKYHSVTLHRKSNHGIAIHASFKIRISYRQYKLSWLW